MALTLMASCGDDDGGSERADTPSTTATTIAPETTGSSAPEQTSTTAAATGSEDPAARLLTVDDLPTGWSEAPELTEDDEESGAAELCADVVGPDLDVPNAERGFKAGDLGPFLLHAVAIVDDEAQARDVMSRFTTCIQDPPAAGGFTVAPLSFPSLGDETVAARLSLDAQSSEDDGGGFPATVDLAMIRQGRLVTIVAGIGVFEAVDPQVLEGAARVAAERLES
jgi:hypothetical protein